MREKAAKGGNKIPAKAWLVSKSVGARAVRTWKFAVGNICSWESRRQNAEFLGAAGAVRFGKSG